MIGVIATQEPGSGLLHGKSEPRPPLLDEYHVEWMPKLRAAAYAVADDARRDEPGQVIIMAGFRAFVNLLAQRDGDRILLPPSEPPAILGLPLLYSPSLHDWEVKAASWQRRVVLEVRSRLESQRRLSTLARVGGTRTDLRVCSRCATPGCMCDGGRP